MKLLHLSSPQDDYSVPHLYSSYTLYIPLAVYSILYFTVYLFLRSSVLIVVLTSVPAAPPQSLAHSEEPSSEKC